MLLGAVGVDGTRAALAADGPLGVTWWDWLAGPSVAMCVLIIMAIFTTSGTFMLLFLAALQNISGEIEEAAMMDGAGAVPQVLLGDAADAQADALHRAHPRAHRHLAGVRPDLPDRAGAPGKTLLDARPSSPTTRRSRTCNWGQGAAIAFILFVIIVALTLLQRWVLRDRDLGEPRARRAPRGPRRMPHALDQRRRCDADDHATPRPRPRRGARAPQRRHAHRRVHLACARSRLAASRLPAARSRSRSSTSTRS